MVNPSSVDTVMYRLAIGNKLYSSWSLRPWLLMRERSIPFEETVIPLNLPSTKASILNVSPSGKVPALIDWDVVVWESLAIVEYLAEKHPKAGIWPAHSKARAHARAISSEAHAGFSNLRKACPMNLGKRYANRDRGSAVGRDVARLTEIIRDTRSRYGSSGSFLYGSFCAADAMFAPYATRLDTYSIPVDDVSRAYIDAILSLSSFRQWREDALREKWVIAEDEVNEPPIATFRQAIATANPDAT